MNHDFTSSPSDEASGPMGVTFDVEGRVLGVSISSLPDDLRRPAPLARELRQSLARARAGMMPDVEPETDAAGLYVARKVVRPPRTSSLRDLVGRARPDLAPQPDVTVPGRETGVSDNRCVTVTLDQTGPDGDIDVDPSWLSQATSRNVGAAITEAFQDAYRERNAR